MDDIQKIYNAYSGELIQSLNNSREKWFEVLKNHENNELSKIACERISDIDRVIIESLNKKNIPLVFYKNDLKRIEKELRKVKELLEK